MHKKSQGQTMLVIFLLTLAILLVYFPVFSHLFQMKWDDQWVVINFYTEHGLTWNNIRAIFSDFYHGQYAPLNQMSYTLIYSAVGYEPLWFHAFGIFLHLCNVLLAYFFIKGLLAYRGGFAQKSIDRIALMTALVMAVHPFLVESVAWLSASKVLIYAFFYLAGLNLYLKYLSAGKWVDYFLVLLCFICSFGGKEQAVTFPVCLLLLDYVLLRDLSSRKVWMEKLPFFLLSFAFGYLTMLSQGRNGEGVLSHAMHYPFYQNVIFAAYALTEYLVKCLIPVNLSYLYPFPNEMGQSVPVRFWIYPLLALFIAAFLWDMRKKQWIIFSAVFFLIHLGLVVHLIPISRFAIVADRYAYIASIGIFFLMAYFIDQVLEMPSYRRITQILFTVYVLAIGAYAHQHSKVWHDSDLLKKELKGLLNQRNEFENQQHDTN